MRQRVLTLTALSALVCGVSAGPAGAHDIPNARVDRSTQVTVEPGRLRIDYEVSLSELTLTQELRSLIGALPGAERRDWFSAYGRETGPLNAKGFLVAVGEEPVTLRADGFDLAVEEHPRYTFHFSATIPGSGRLSVVDSNFGSSEGTCRLAVRGSGVEVRGDDLPSDVESIPIRPAWQLTDAEERRTRRVKVGYGPRTATETRPSAVLRSPPSPKREPPAGGSSSRLARLFDRASALPVGVVWLVAFGLGAAHAFQPGHGKALVAATAVGGRGGWWRGAAVAVVTTLTHTGSVLLVAAVLWWTGSLRFSSIHLALGRGAGFVIAAVGLWRLGRHLAGYSEHDGGHEAEWNGRGVVGLGVAGGLVPCWDAVGLVVLAEAVGRLGLGLSLVAAFGLGMGAVLVLVGWAASALRKSLTVGRDGADWERRLGLASGTMLAVIGVSLLRM